METASLENKMDDILENPRLLENIPISVLNSILQKGIRYDVKNAASDDNNADDDDKYAPKKRRFRKSATTALNRAASLFILYITTIAHDIAKSQKRVTILEKDIMAALGSTLFWDIERELIERRAGEAPENEASVASEKDGPVANDDANNESNQVPIDSIDISTDSDHDDEDEEETDYQEDDDEDDDDDDVDDAANEQDDGGTSNEEDDAKSQEDALEVDDPPSEPSSDEHVQESSQL